LLLAVGLLLMRGGVAPTTVFAAPPDTAGVFELDGNACANTSAGTDWDTLFNPATALSGSAITTSTNNCLNSAAQGGTGTHGTNNHPFGQAFINEPAGTDNTYLTGGSSKDNSDFSNWLLQTTCTGVAPNISGCGVQSKDEIDQAFASLYDTPTDQFMYFGDDRFANNGDAFTGFWITVNPVGFNGKDGFSCSTALCNSNGTPATHSVGDILISSNFTNGGAKDEVRLYEWLPSAADGPLHLLSDTFGKCGDGSGNSFCEITNTGNVAAPWTYQFKPSGPPIISPTFPAETFFEGGIDLTTIAQGKCFSTFIAETRSSQSFTSTLSDIALHNFSTCAKPNITTSGSVTADGQTTPIPTDNNGGFQAKIPINSTTSDTATLGGPFGAPSGRITFNLYKNDPTCGSNGASTTTRVFTDTETLVQGASTSSATSTSYTASSLGTYYWQDTYDPNGDPHYLGTQEACQLEVLTVVDAKITISPLQAANRIGSNHPLTISLASTTDGTNYSPVDGALIQPISIATDTSGHAQLSSDHCTTAGPGTGEGTCGVTLTDTATGVVTVSATASHFSVPGVTGTFTRMTGDGLSGDSGNAKKYWIDAELLINPLSAVNASGTPHTVTATLKVDYGDGNGFVALQGKSVTFSLVNNQALATFTSGSVPAGPYICTATDASGNCTATITSSSVGTVNIHAVSTFSVTPSGCTDATHCSVTFNLATDGTGHNSQDAGKSYVNGRIYITPHSAVNIVGNPETFTIQVQTATSQTGGAPNWVNAGAGVSVTYSIVVTPDTPSDATFVANNTTSPACPQSSSPSGNAFALGQGPTTTTTDSNGQVKVTVLSCLVGSIQVHASASFDSSVFPGLPTLQNFTRATGDSANTGLSDTTTCGDGTSNCFSDALKTYYNPTTTLSVTDLLTGLHNDFNGNVIYKAYIASSFSAAQSACTADTGATAGTDETPSPNTVTSGQVPSSLSVSVPNGTTVFFRAHFDGTTGVAAGQHFTSPCNEIASSGNSVP
jgi:hypothetical protein